MSELAEQTYQCEECEQPYPEKKMLETLDICVYCDESLEQKRTNVVPLSRTEWSDRMALDLALILEGSGDQVSDLLNHYRITGDDLKRFSADKIFKTRVAHFRREIATEGLGFRMKARVQAEELLQTSWNLIHDPSVSPNVKSDLIKSTVKWAGLEPKPDALEGGGGGGQGVRININLGNTNQAIAIDGETYDSDITDV
jgi:hypothetical protein